MSLKDLELALQASNVTDVSDLSIIISASCTFHACMHISQDLPPVLVNSTPQT